ncbi:MAG TPA: DNA polymerase/3'-5' exonuclease PolX [Phycisphaerales bacterium]|nr:DNA polymerase/3'-5' exonuclease PolX [Phycisphaerales bacterium]
MSANAALAERFSLISRLMDLLGEDTFKVLAHAKASRVIGDLAQDLEPIARLPAAEARKKLVELEGVGPKIADKIIEFVTTGKIHELEELRGKVPHGLVPLMEIPGLGPKTVAVLWKQGGVEDLAGLKRIIADGSILSLPRMGEKAVAKIKESIALAEQGSQRLQLGLAIPIAERIVEQLKRVKGVKHVAFAGSARRGKETVGDLDILATAAAAAAVSEAFRTMPDVRQVIAAGETRSSVRIAIDPEMGRWTLEGKEGEERVEPTIQVDLRVLDDSCWGAALLYFTGSKDHNVRLRERALKKGLTLNEYGLFPEDGEKEPPQKRGVKPVAARTEEDVYHKLDLEWIPPEMREDRGELQTFARHGPARDKASHPKGAEPPVPIELGDIRAELHAHTTASDGRLSIEELAHEAKRRGFHTIAVTDHSKSSVIANGLQPDRLRRHIRAIHAARDKVKGITILAGSEVDILADGSLDYDDDLLAELDIVVASPHTGLSQDPAAATRRLLRAIRHPLVHILGHPTGRLINRRAGLSPDIGELAAAAREHSVALEINAHWMRLDLRDTHVRVAVEAGATIAIDCDVHETADFDNLKFGVMTARRGWLTAHTCVNAWGAEKLTKWLRSKR